MVLVAERQADVPVQRRVVQRGCALREFDSDDAEPRAAAALAAAAGDGSSSKLTRRSVPRLVLRADGCDGGAVLPVSHTRSTPNAAAERMIEPTLNGWVTESSSKASLPVVLRRHCLFSLLMSVGRNCLGAFGGGLRVPHGSWARLTRWPPGARRLLAASVPAAHGRPTVT